MHQQEFPLQRCTGGPRQTLGASRIRNRNAVCAPISCVVRLLLFVSRSEVLWMPCRVISGSGKCDCEAPNNSGNITEHNLCGHKRLDHKAARWPSHAIIPSIGHYDGKSSSRKRGESRTYTVKINGQRTLTETKENLDLLFPDFSETYINRGIFFHFLFILSCHRVIKILMIRSLSMKLDPGYRT
jgi:hypothetical protein